MPLNKETKPSTRFGDVKSTDRHFTKTPSVLCNILVNLFLLNEKSIQLIPNICGVMVTIIGNEHHFKQFS